MRRAALIAALATACAGSTGTAPASVAELRFALASDPQDDAARARLARALDSAGHLGAALEQWDVLVRRGAVPAGDRGLVAERLVARARARLERGDAGAERDVRVAARLAPGTVPHALRARAHDAELAHALRVSSEPTPRAKTRAQALARRRLPALVRGPQGADIAECGAVGRWLWTHGARRAAREWLRVYSERGGDDAAVLRQHVEAESWWAGTGAQLSLAAIRASLSAGALDCGLADRGCPDVVRGVEEPALSAELWRRTADGFVRTADPLQASAWVAVALRKWLGDPERGWLVRVAERVDVEAATRAASLPVFAAATLLRAAGQPDRAREALDRAVELAPRLPPGQRAVVVAELVVLGDPRAEAVGGAVPGDLVVAELLARHRGAGLFPVEGVGDATLPPLAQRVLSRAPAGAQVAWSEIVNEYWRAPVRADAAAQRYVDARVLRTARALEVAALFRDLGDPQRYRRWSELAARESPLDAEAHYHRGVAATIAGAPAEGDVHLVRAAALAGDRGAVFARAAADLSDAGEWLSSVFLARRALPLRAPGHRHLVLETLVRASRALGRDPQASAYAERLPHPSAETLADTTDVPSAIRRGDLAVIERVAQLNPASAAAHAELLRRGSPTQASRAAKALKRIAIGGPRRAAGRAAAALASAGFRGGDGDVSPKEYERLARALATAVERSDPRP